MYRVFVVDDEYEIRKGLINFFPWEMLGFQVAGQAENGKQALDLILKSAGTIDVLLTDIKMPVMGGIELVKHLNENGIKLKVILLSAYNDFEYARDGLKLGVYDYALKPTEYKNLIQTFSRLKQQLDQQKELLSDKSEADYPQNYKSKLISTAKQYLKINYATTNLEDTARYVNLSPCYLSTIFKEETGIGFSDYLIKVKMENAARLLLDINYKIYEISELVGYSNAKNFTRVVKKFYGVSPREYRNSMGGAARNEK
jgi:two-component system response regulator YesN